MMDDTIMRFPHIGEGIFEQLGNNDLTNCREVNESWKNFIAGQKIPWIRIIQKYSGSMKEFFKHWKQSIDRSPTKIVRKLAIHVEKFFQANPGRKILQWSPHFIVADQGDLDLYEYLTDKIGCTNPRKYDVQYVDLEEFLTGQSGKIIDEGASPFTMAVAKGHTEICKFVLEKLGVIILFNSEVPMLHLAARYGHLEVYKLLMEYFPSKNLFSEHGWTPLHEAASSGHLKVCTYLMSRVSNMNPNNIINGITALHLAASYNQLDICKLFIEKEVYLGPQMNSGKTPLHFAAEAGHLQVCELLMENMVDKNPREFQLSTPLHFAAEAGHLQVCELLMENIVDKNPRDFQLSTPFHSAAKNGHVKVCKLFMDNNIMDIKNLMDASGISPIKHALLNKQIEVCKLITDNVEDEDLQNKPINLFLYICMLLLLLPRTERHLLLKFWSFQVDLAFCACFLFTLAVPTIVAFFYPGCVGIYFILLYVSSIPFFIGLSRILHYYLKRSKQLNNI